MHRYGVSDSNIKPVNNSASLSTSTPHEKDHLVPLLPDPPKDSPKMVPSSEAPAVVDGDTTYIVSKPLQVKLTKFQ
ncbi:hypothetical protein TNCV_991611 [Trichonephila clavipes]|nr:hypothetical protein TNCV_991611 [Trichonephila clavipes]